MGHALHLFFRAGKVPFCTNLHLCAKHPYARLRAVQQRLTGVAMGRCKIGSGVSPDQDRLGIGA